MALQVFLAATLRKCVPDYDGAVGHRIEVDSGATIRDVALRLGLPLEEVKLIMLNGVSAGWDSVLQGDERLAFFPPVGGG